MRSRGKRARSSAALAFVTSTFVGHAVLADGEGAANPESKENAEATARAVRDDRSHEARADLPDRLADEDTADGRVDGDLGLVVGVGLDVNPRAYRGAAELRLRYLDTAGVFLTYEDAFGSGSADPLRVFAAGVELRPFFLGRWVTGSELGLGWVDLVIDSLGLEVGAFVEQRPAADRGPSSGVQVSGGLEIPLFGRASGLWLDFHGGARWSDAALSGLPEPGPSDRALFLSMTIAYHQLVATHLVDVNDQAP